jgi:hypothetical protein
MNGIEHSNIINPGELLAKVHAYSLETKSHTCTNYQENIYFTENNQVQNR